MSQTISIRPMRRADLDIAMGWAKAEGWNPGLDDADAFYAADPDGFLMGWHGDIPVSAISVVKSGTDFGFLGLYIVHPDYRGQGYGKALWDAGLKYLAGRTIGLDGVVAQQDNYRQSGFDFAYRSVRYAGKPAPLNAIANVEHITPRLLGSIMAYDSTLYPAVRQAFLQHWLKQTDNRHGVAHIANGIVRGYGVIRKSVEGYKIGPLFAENAEIAESLLAALMAFTGSEQICLDIPEPNVPAITLATRAGLKPIFETARMYLGSPPALPLAKIFGTTTLELG